MASREIDNFLQRLNGVRKDGSGWMARCPCRDDDSNPSMHVAEGDDGRVLVTCHRGSPCSLDQICEAVDLDVKDLMPPKPTKEEEPRLTLVKAYSYFDESGELLFQKQRFMDQFGKKTFRQRKPDGRGGWSYSLGSTPKVLYNLPAVMAAKANGEHIWVVEGEKDADAVNETGEVATTMPNGAGSWAAIHTNALAGASITIIADNDKPGIEHAINVYNQLTAAGCEVEIVRPPDNAKDIAELLGRDGTLGQLLKVDPTEIPEEPLEEPDEFSGVLSAIEKLASNPRLTTQQKVTRAQQALDRMQMGDDPFEDNGLLVDWEDFINEEADDSYDWVIPGVLERGERVIVVAAEGVGKTMLARQIAICSAAGIQPFTRSTMKPITTLTIDLENPARIIRRTSTKIMRQAQEMGRVKKINAHILIKPAGLNLLSAKDRVLVEDVIEKTKPDLICIGPLYKAFTDPGTKTSEAVAIEVAKYLDTIRTHYNCALWMEHHAPLGSSIGGRDLRPFGSAVWSRWPEFGLALEPDPTATERYTYNVKNFRGERDVRNWPKQMQRDTTFPFKVTEYRTVD
jgi:5S rRNA maturation endonuclease (ribonuclease M5)